MIKKDDEKNIRKKFSNFYNDTYVRYYASKIKEVLKGRLEESLIIATIIWSIFLILMLTLGAVCYISYYFSSEIEQIAFMKKINSCTFQWEFIKWTVLLQMALYILFVLLFGYQIMEPVEYRVVGNVGEILFGMILYGICTGLYCLAATVFPNIKPFIWLLIFETVPIVIMSVWQIAIELKQIAIELKEFSQAIEKILKRMREK